MYPSTPPSLPFLSLSLSSPRRTSPPTTFSRVEKSGEGRLDGPDDVHVDGDGTLYTVMRDGWIKRMHSNGSWEDWKLVGGSSLLGLTLSMAGDVLVCDADKGLLKVGKEEVVPKRTAPRSASPMM